MCKVKEFCENAAVLCLKIVPPRHNWMSGRNNIVEKTGLAQFFSEARLFAGVMLKHLTVDGDALCIDVEALCVARVGVEYHIGLAVFVGGE